MGVFLQDDVVFVFTSHYQKMNLCFGYPKNNPLLKYDTMQEFHMRYHEETGITFASFYPGCISTTGLFREHISMFRLLFPPFQKYITKGYVSEDEAEKRLAQVVDEPSLTKSGVYWSWNKDSASFKNQLLEEASDVQKARKMWEIGEKLIGLKVHPVVQNLDFVEILSL